MSLRNWFENCFAESGERKTWFLESCPCCGQMPYNECPSDCSFRQRRCEPPKPTERPRLAAVLTAPSRDEFAAWRDEPVTRFVMAALIRNAEECKEQWMQRSWYEGAAAVELLIAMRERSDALLGFTADYEAFCETLNLEPEVPNAA